MACANVATNSPTANWLGLSLRKFWTIRGENWPIASWTTTIVIVRTSAASDTIDAAMVSRMVSAASGSPVTHSGTAWKPNALAAPTVATERITPARTHMTGTNQRLERRADNRGGEPIRRAAYPTSRGIQTPISPVIAGRWLDDGRHGATGLGDHL